MQCLASLGEQVRPRRVCRERGAGSRGCSRSGFECGHQETSSQALTMILNPAAGEPQGGFGACVTVPHPARLTHRPGPMSREFSVETFELGHVLTYRCVPKWESSNPNKRSALDGATIAKFLP